jgi:hypothetical protein
MSTRLMGAFCLLLTVVYEPVETDDAQGQVDEVQEEMPVVVDADAVVHPRTVTGVRR